MERCDERSRIVLCASSEISTVDLCAVFKRLVKTIPSVDFTITLTEIHQTRVGGFCTFTNYQSGNVMSMKKFIGNYAAFNEWANHRIVGWLQTLDLDLLYAETPSSYTSIDYTLQHILRTQRFWIRFIGGKDLSDFNWAVREREVENIMN